MISFNSNSSKFKMTLAGYPTSTPGIDGLLYTASKIMLRIERLDTSVLSVFSIRTTPNPNEWKGYYSDPSGVLEIPLKNVVNANAANGSVTLEVNMRNAPFMAVVDQATKVFSILPGIDEKDAFIPLKEDEAPLYLSVPTVMPPNIIINPVLFGGGSAPGTIVESGIQNQQMGITWKQYILGVASTITPTGTRNNQLPISADATILEVDNGTKKKTWKLEKPDKCTDLVCVRWTSLTGAVRQHYFPVVSFTTGNDKSVSLINSGDGYDVLKNSYDSVTCRISGLTAYGYWYYMDLLRASEVYAINHSSTLPWVPVTQELAFVETQNASTPSGNGFFDFEFTLRMKHYDTV